MPKRVDIQAIDSEFEREKQECTFYPNIRRFKKKVLKPQIDPTVTVTVERIKEISEERDRIQRNLERRALTRSAQVLNNVAKRSSSAYSKSVNQQDKVEEHKNELKITNKSIDQKQNHKEIVENDEEEKEEKLYIDINLGANIERIIVHKGDTASDLSAKFCVEHGK